MPNQLQAGAVYTVPSAPSKVPSIPYEAGDILAVQGAGWFSDHIRECTGGLVSHIAGFINDDPPIILEALMRVRTNPLDVTVKSSKRAWVLHHNFLTPEQRRIIIYTACGYSTDAYGWGDILLQGTDAVTHTRFWTDHLSKQLKDKPICSYIWAAAYEQAGFKWPGVSLDSITPADVFRIANATPDFTVSELIL